MKIQVNSNIIDSYVHGHTILFYFLPKNTEPNYHQTTCQGVMHAITIIVASLQCRSSD